MLGCEPKLKDNKKMERLSLRCYVDWIDHADEQHDFAVITRDRDIGLQTGWMGLYTTLPSSSMV